MATIRYGTCSWSEKSWVGPFYAVGTKPGDMLPAYCTQFDTVEADSTYYARPSFALVQRWADVTPPGFVMSSKMPCEFLLGGSPKDCTAESALAPLGVGPPDAYFAGMGILGPKCGPILLQCPYFRAELFKDLACFLARLGPFIDSLHPGFRYALEIRNPKWLHQDLLDLLREKRVAFCLSNVRGMPHPAEVAERFDVSTTDFFYARLIGDHAAVDKLTKTFDRVVIDQSERLKRWSELLPALVRASSQGGFVYANNHYAGHGPATIRQLRGMVEGAS